MPGTGGLVGESAPLKHAVLHLDHTRFHSLLIEGTPNLIGNIGTGSPNIVQIGGTEQVAFALDVNDELHARIDISELQDFDLSKDLLAEVKYDGTATSTTDPSIEVHVKGIAVGEAILDVFTAPDGSKAFACPTTTGNIEKVSPRKGLLVAGLLVNDSCVLIGVKLASLGSLSANQILFEGVTLYGERNMFTATGVKATS